MNNKDYFRNKKVTVVGLARSGFACARLLSDLGAQVSVTDNQASDATSLYAFQLKSKIKNIMIETGLHSCEFITGRDMIVISPGVPDTALPVTLAKQLEIPVISEIELASILCPANIIAVTGSNGKTTVTTLIGKILQANGKKVFVCGNIGNPFSGELEKMEAGDFVSLEVSSFQLEKIRKFKPKISVILNFTRNHLDRYLDMEEYLEAKKRIFMNQDESDYLVLNNSDPVVKGLANHTKAKVVYFNETRDLNSNQAAVLAVASILDISADTCMEVFREFKGIEHRLEYVAEINNVIFINDSKSTTVDSTMWAFRNISSPIILIAGGKHKGVDYGIISDLARQKARAVILIGEAKEKINNVLKGILPISEAATLEEAVKAAFSRAKPGDCVLLSPMCSSYDMFLNYEERGKVFKRAVIDLTANNHGA
ncbi:MAG: UDP-N-acetylmuramoyl-L-alanine--D-glutamate ligase [Candidatus Omnitrophica bacterium]|nr:UDP-N-acetylmuramoyl-L-alanine--D-glutamate ligase [Candidatus Omnitrophota bacterium]